MKPNAVMNASNLQDENPNLTTIRSKHEDEHRRIA